jgi:hypothetical protein
MISWGFSSQQVAALIQIINQSIDKPSIHPFIHPSIHSSIHSFIHQSINQSINQSIPMMDGLLVCPSFDQGIWGCTSVCSLHQCPIKQHTS